VNSLDVICTVTLDEVGDKGHLIVSSELDVRARADGVDAEGLERAVRAADQGCTFSKLIRASASVSVRAELESN
jgi:organic hydroperoxide reductase OsmC/OhrA